jgi:hypothetical protein
MFRTREVAAEGVREVRSRVSLERAGAQTNLLRFDPKPVQEFGQVALATDGRPAPYREDRPTEPFQHRRRPTERWLGWEAV